VPVKVEAPVTPKVPPTEALPNADSVPVNVEAPVTPRVPPTLALPRADKVPVNVEAPVTPRVPPTEAFPRAESVPVKVDAPVTPSVPDAVTLVADRVLAVVPPVTMRFPPIVTGSPSAPVWKRLSAAMTSRIALLIPLGAQPSAMFTLLTSVLSLAVDEYSEIFAFVTV
jgi:hypothetical protein